MKKFFTTISLLTVGLALTWSGVALAQQKTAAPKAAPTKTPPAVGTRSDSKTAQGRISKVDAKTKTLTVTEGAKSLTFLWDDNTKLTEAGHAVKPSALVSGAQVTVQYMEKGGKNWASSITITPAAGAAKPK